MKVLVTGSGGREHALAWRVAQSRNVERVYVAPGNAGTAMEPGIENLPMNVMDFDAQIDFASREGIDLTIIGPEAPLVEGVVDRFEEAGLKCFGPTGAAAQLEGSKSFCKDFLARHQIPTAGYAVFEEAGAALAHLRSDAVRYPVVVKADGLAAGKGVVVAVDQAEAETAVEGMFSGKMLGDAGTRVVIEDFLVGEEASFIVLADGRHALPFASSQDHKTAYDGDTGPNTGGMGAYSPAPVVTPEVHERVMQKVILPTIRGMAKEGAPYVGFLYAGLMIDPTGEPWVIEFNCRFGDPEAQPVMSRLGSDLAALCLAAIDGDIQGRTIDFDDRVALTVVAASGGYPGDYATGKPIAGLPDAQAIQDLKVFHAGTALDSDQVLTSGGRVLGVTALADGIAAAQALAYRGITAISFDGMHARTDIGHRAIARAD